MEDGNWNDRLAQYFIFISSAWWQTGWFKAVTVLLICALALLVFDGV